MSQSRDQKICGRQKALIDQALESGVNLWLNKKIRGEPDVPVDESLGFVAP